MSRVHVENIMHGALVCFTMLGLALVLCENMHSSKVCSSELCRHVILAIYFTSLVRTSRGVQAQAMPQVVVHVRTGEADGGLGFRCDWKTGEVLHVQRDSWAWQQGLRAGSEIIAVNREVVKGMSQARFVSYMKCRPLKLCLQSKYRGLRSRRKRSNTPIRHVPPIAGSLSVSPTSAGIASPLLSPAGSSEGDAGSGENPDHAWYSMTPSPSRHISCLSSQKQLQFLLSDAAHQGDVRSVRSCLDAGARAGDKVMGDWSPLLLASQSGHTEICQALLEFQADPAETVDGDQSALMLAVDEGHVDLAMLMLGQIDKGSLDYKDKSGFSLVDHLKALHDDDETDDSARRQVDRAIIMVGRCLN